MIVNLFWGQIDVKQAVGWQVLALNGPFRSEYYVNEE